jgi:hypothetical protein
MRRSLSPVIVLTAAVVSAVAVFVYATLPPRAVRLDAALPPTIVSGAYHIHSNRSDGSGSVDEIAAAAHDAGLAFVILTDHGDGTRPVLPPAYRDGVLVIDAVELNTNAGHLVALGLADASPYPMAGPPADVLEDVHRRGGFGIVAHPDSPRPDLQWRAWNVAYDGVEWLNADSEWRDESALRLTGVGLRTLVRAPETIASLFQRPTTTLRRWDSVSRRRPVVGLAGLDAHANLLGHPRYADMFRVLTQDLILDEPLSGDASRDATAVIEALRRGRTYAVVTAFAGPAALSFTAEGAGQTLRMGDQAPAAGALTWTAAIAGAPNARLVLLADGRQIAAGRGSLRYSGPADPGAYRVEAEFPGFAMPWVVSNPIYVGDLAGAGAADITMPPSPSPVDLTTAPGWRVEHDATSTGTIERDGDGFRAHFVIGGGTPAGQYVAFAVPVENRDGMDRIQLRAHSDRPMRVSVQVRLPGPTGGQRWRRSMYVDGTDRLLVLPLASFEPADRQTSQKPIVSLVEELLVVVDTLNTLPGTHGTIWISAVGLGRARADGPTSGR